MDQLNEDQSHYEISLTAGQAFVAFVLLLLSLAASFAFGLMIGKGQADDRLIVRKEPAVINEASALSKKSTGKIVELGVPADDFRPAEEKTTDTALSVAQTLLSVPAQAGVPVPHQLTTTEPAVAAYAQLLSTADQKTAEALAAKVIDGGFTGAFVERTATDKGTTFRVRVRFPSETEAHAAEPKLREFSKEVWITK